MLAGRADAPEFVRERILEGPWGERGGDKSGRVGVAAGWNGSASGHFVAGRLAPKVGRAHLKHT